MNTKTRIYLGLSMLFGADLACATGNITWQCIAKDANHKQWTINSNYQRNAINHALEACKKESTLPTTCQALDNDCDSLLNGLSTKPLWRCISLDQTATPWTGKLSSNKDDAALSAKSSCKEQSTLPGTCYINMLTCTNLNLR